MEFFARLSFAFARCALNLFGGDSPSEVDGDSFAELSVCLDCVVELLDPDDWSIVSCFFGENVNDLRACTGEPRSVESLKAFS